MAISWSVGNGLVRHVQVEITKECRESEKDKDLKQQNMNF